MPARDADRALLLLAPPGPGAEPLLRALRRVDVPCLGHGRSLSTPSHGAELGDEGLDGLLERALRRLGSSGHDVRTTPPLSPDAPALDDLRSELGARIQGLRPLAPWLVLGDPRLCRLVCFVRPLLEDLGVTPCFLVLVPDPVDAAEALDLDASVPWARSMLLWLRHLLEAERATRAAARAILPLESLLREGAAALAPCLARLGLVPPRPLREAEGALETGLAALRGRLATRTQAAPRFEVGVERWAREVHGALLHAAHDGDATLATLDEVAEQLAAASRDSQRRLVAREDGRRARAALASVRPLAPARTGEAG